VRGPVVVVLSVAAAAVVALPTLAAFFFTGLATFLRGGGVASSFSFSITSSSRTIFATSALPMSKTSTSGSFAMMRLLIESGAQTRWYGTLPALILNSPSFSLFRQVLQSPIGRPLQETACSMVILGRAMGVRVEGRERASGWAVAASGSSERRKVLE